MLSYVSTVNSVTTCILANILYHDGQQMKRKLWVEMRYVTATFIPSEVYTGRSESFYTVENNCCTAVVYFPPSLRKKTTPICI
jgi:hypothetical protein